MALDNANSQGFETGGTGCTGTNTNFVCSFNHTTNSVIGSTGLLVVGVSINQRNNTPVILTSVTYNGTAKTLARSRATGNFVASNYYLKNPPVGTFSVAVSGTKSNTGNVLGLLVGAMTLYEVDLTGTITAAEGGGNGTIANLTTPIASATNNGVVDTLASEGG